MTDHKKAFRCSIDPATNDTEDKCRTAGGSWDEYNSTLHDYKTIELGIFQQTFLGMSIMDWNANLGFNGNGSSISVNLVKDEFNYRSFLTPSGTRDAITEGYHSWSPDAFPVGLLEKYSIDSTGGAEPGNPETGMGHIYSTYGDIDYMPDPGEPVFFHYYNGADLDEDCILERNCPKAFSFPGILTKYEKRFSTSGLTYSVNIADPRTILENTTVILNGLASRVAPSDFFTVMDSTRRYEDGWNGYYNILNVYGYYEHHGFNKSDRTEAGMLWLDPKRTFNTDWSTERCIKSGGVIHSAGTCSDASFTNEADCGLAGEIWTSAADNCIGTGGEMMTNGGSHMFGILPALMEMTRGANISYISHQEPFGGPMTYSVDSRFLDVKAPFAEIPAEGRSVFAVGPSRSTHRYLIDLEDFLNLSPYDPSWGVIEELDGTEGFIPTDYRVPGDTMSLLQIIQQVCEVAASDFYVTLEPITKKLIDRNFVLPEDYESIKHYSGIIKVVVVPRNVTITKDALSDAVDLSQKVPPEGPFKDVENNPTLVSSTLGYEFTDPIEGKILLGAPRTRVVGVTPIGDRKLRKELFYNRQSDKYLDMSTRAYKCFTAWPANVEVAAVDETDCLSTAGNVWKEVDTTGANPAPIEHRDSILTEYLPNVEIDGVTLTNQDTPADTFLDGVDLGWNPYGKVGQTDPVAFPDFLQNLPSVSNDDYLPWHWPQDYSGPTNDEADPFQFNRVGSLHQAEAGSCVFSGNTPDSEYCSDASGGNTGDVNKAACVGGGNTWGAAGDEDACSTGGGNWTADFARDSGYLDIFPCWGYIEYEHTEGGAHKNLHGVCMTTSGGADISVTPQPADKEACEALGYGDHWWVPDTPSAIEATDPLLDIVDNTVQGKPIKGFSWDDDPYRDFNPVEGVFSGIEFWNPAIGICENPADGSVIPAFENMQNICECNLAKAGSETDCTRIRALDAGLYKFRPHCRAWSACRNKAGGDIDDVTGGIAGSGNTVSGSAWGCEFGCFDIVMDTSVTPPVPRDPVQTGTRIAAFYAEDFDDGDGFTRVRGEAATAADPSWGPNKDKKIVQLMQSAQDCVDTGHMLTPVVLRDSFRITANGDAATAASCDINSEDNDTKAACEQPQCDGARGKAEADCTGAGETWKAGGGTWTEGDENDHESGGGLYSDECIALSFRYEWEKGCISQSDQFVAGSLVWPKGSRLPPPTYKDCEAWGDTGKWETIAADDWPDEEKDAAGNPLGYAVKDPYYGIELEPEDIPTPGYTSTRQRLKGECHIFSVEKLGGGECLDDAGDSIDAPDKETCEADPPGGTWVESGQENTEDQGPPENPTNDPRECYQKGSPADDDTGDLETRGKMVYKPIDLKSGIGLPLKCRTSTIPIDLGQIDYYGGPKPAHNDPGNQFQDFHYATVTELRHAAASKESWLYFMRELQAYLPCHMWHQDPVPGNYWGDWCPTEDKIIIEGGMSGAYISAANALTGFAGRGVYIPSTKPTPGKAKVTVAEPCGDPVEKTIMSRYEKSSMMADLAYKKVVQVATQFYGRKYLVPLPFNPPTTITCTNPSYKDKADCEESGFDWGTHGLQSEWFHKMGVGRCANGISPDKYTCEIVNGDIWIEPIQEINRWEVATAGWPGGDIEYNFGSQESKAVNAGYPQNMNFWTDDGNLKSFVIFPEKEWQRFSGNAVPVSFGGFDAESFYQTPFNAGPHDNWGGKVFVPTQVDPKTHWLTERPDWEVHHELQYKKYLAGSPMELPKGGETDKELEDLAKIAEVGPKAKIDSATGLPVEDNTTRVLNERAVITKGTTGAFPKETLTDYAAYKPYALVTLPAAALYSQTDESKKLHDSVGGEKNHMCVPLLSAKNANSLLQAWLMGWDPLSIAKQNIVAWGARVISNSQVAPDMKKGSFKGAIYKPWHAAVPQQSRHYKWGAWAAGWDFGKPDFQIDEALHPAAFGGEKGMNKAAMARIKSTIGKAQNRTQETGSIQLTGIPAYAFGTQLIYKNAAGEIIKSPYITDVSVQIGTGGLTTTYNFTTSRKFGDLTKTYEDRIRKSQRDLLANMARTEELIRRTKRGIDQYQTGKS